MAPLVGWLVGCNPRCAAGCRPGHSKATDTVRIAISVPADADHEQDPAAAHRRTEQLWRETYRVRQEQAAEKAERERRGREEAAERARTRKKNELEEREARSRTRRELVAAFLRQHGFKGVRAMKRMMLRNTYPLHRAAEGGDQQMVTMLLDEGADPLQRDSTGKTAKEVAERRDRGGSHSAVLQLLAAAAPQVAAPAAG